MRARPAARRLLVHAAEGMDRVARIIDGVPNYDLLLKERVSETERKAYQVLSLGTVRARALNKMAERIALGGKVLALREPGIACDGRTSNNLREFAFLNRLCGRSILGTNYATSERVPGPCRDHFGTVARALILRAAAAFYSKRERITAGLAHQQAEYAHTLLFFARSLHAPDAVVPCALVQANDHSPQRVAASMVFKALGVPRIYLQHAEVSSYFPPLDMEHAVLRNARSLETYAAIGPVAGHTYVIPRGITPDLPSLARERGSGVKVVVYPTSRVNASALRDVIAKLVSNSHVAQVALKPHPGATVSAADLLGSLADEVSYLDTIPEFDHVAVVGNSSVSVDLLQHGIPVYQCFTFDAVEADYYGLVASGITLPAEDLTGRFWTPYSINAAWRTAFARLAPDPADAQADVRALIGAINALTK